jgi:hypothetical protein
MRRAFLLAFVGTVLLPGCSRAPRLAKVSGRVTVGGHTLSTGTITFHNENGLRPAIGQIQPDGSYVLTTYDVGDGAVVGEHVVTIAAIKAEPNFHRPATPEEEAIMVQRGNTGPKMVYVHGKVESLVAEIYTDVKTSPLKRNVENKVNQIDINIEGPAQSPAE